METAYANPGTKGMTSTQAQYDHKPSVVTSITSWNSISSSMLPHLARTFSSGLRLLEMLPLCRMIALRLCQHQRPVPPGQNTNCHFMSSVVYDRNWESDMESLLKVRYTLANINLTYNFCRTCTMPSRVQRWVLQPLNARTSISSLTPNTPLMRNRSLRVQQDRLTTLKRGSIRGIQSILGAQNGMSPYK